MENKTDQSVGDKHYKRTFGSGKQTGQELEEMEENAAATNENSASSQPPKNAKEVKNLEQTVEGEWKTNRLTNSGKIDSHVGRTTIGWVRHGSAFAFLIGFVGVGIWFSSFFAPNILLVNIKEMFTNDLADATVALYTYDKKMLDHKLGKADCSQKDSIKCKLSTMSRNEVKRFERAGFTVNGEKVEEDNRDDKDYSNDKPESRYKVTSITFPHNGGTASSADDYEKIANKSNNFKALAYSVWDPKSSFFQDERFKQRIKWRYDLTKQITVKGDKEADVNKAFDKSMQGDEEAMDEGGGGNYSLKGLAGDVGKNGLKKVSEKIANITNSYGTIQCAYYSQFKVSYDAMKKAKSVSVARFAMQYLKAADQIKAGLSEEVAANVLSGKLGWSDDGSYFGKNATDGAMYRNIVFNEPAKNESLTLYTLDAFDTIGVILPPWLLTVYLSQQTIKSMMNLPGSISMPSSDLGDSARKYCLETQKDSVKVAHKPSRAPNNCPVLTVGDTPPIFAALVSDIAAASTTICPYPPPVDIGCCWMMYPTASQTVKRVMPMVQNLLTPVVTNWADQTSKNFTSDTKGRNAAEALFAGTGEILGDMAMSRGMRPGNKETMSQYLSLKPAIDKEFDDVARYEGQQNPFDMYNKYSFMGSIIRSFPVTAYDDKTPLLSSLGTIFSAIPTSMRLVGSNDSAKAFYYLQPLKFDSSRLSCNDQEYENIGIKADTLCNIRYSMSTNDLNAKVTDVLDYMLKAHSDETKDQVDELKKRLDETDKGFDTQDRADVQRQYDEAKEGSDAKMIDEKTGAPVKHSQYEKFMTYCVNREMPWGRTGMATRYSELSDDEKADRKQYIYENGIHVQGYKGEPDEINIADSGAANHMAVLEGAAADQDWYTGKKCLEESDMLHNFRAYTMMCMVDGSYAGAADCTEKDSANHYFDGFYHNNDILYTSWW